MAAVEDASAAAWPAAETAQVAGWTVRASGGFSRRVNSGSPPRRPSPNDVDQVREWFGARGLAFVARITPPVAAADAVLAGMGFTREGLTSVMVTRLGKSAPGDGRVVVGTEPTPQWLAVQAELQGVPDDLRASWTGIISRIGHPAGFALGIVDGTPVAAGLAVATGGWMGLFEINVASAYRRNGLGRAMSTALLEWGRGQGARRAYLQVVAGNEPALALYRSVGFEPAYDYWYRRDAGTP